MFRLEKVNHQNSLLDYYHLQSAEVSCNIYPNLGASLQQFSIQKIEIIQGIQPLESDLPYYRRYYPSSFLFPFPGRIAGGNYEYAGTKYQLKTNETDRDNAIHGFIAEASFKLIKQDLGDEIATLNFEYLYLGNEEGFPFPSKVNIIYQISKTSLKINLQINNTGENSFPFALGWHPYFLSQDVAKSELYFQSQEQLITNKNQIPTGTKPIRFKSIIGDQVLDDTYLLKNSVIQFWLLLQDPRWPHALCHKIVESYCTTCILLY